MAAFRGELDTPVNAPLVDEPFTRFASDPLVDEPSASAPLVDAPSASVDSEGAMIEAAVGEEYEALRTAALVHERRRKAKSIDDPSDDERVTSTSAAGSSGTNAAGSNGSNGAGSSGSNAAGSSGNNDAGSSGTNGAGSTESNGGSSAGQSAATLTIWQAGASLQQAHEQKKQELMAREKQIKQESKRLSQEKSYAEKTLLCGKAAARRLRIRDRIRIFLEKAQRRTNGKSERGRELQRESERHVHTQRTTGPGTT